MDEKPEKMPEENGGKDFVTFLLVIFIFTLFFFFLAHPSTQF